MAFNTTLVLFKLVHNGEESATSLIFQYYSSSIQTGLGIGVGRGIRSFQYYSSSIQTNNQLLTEPIEFSFNTTLVLFKPMIFSPPWPSLNLSILL